VDPKVPIETTSEVLAQLLKGKIDATQLSEVSAGTFRQSSNVHMVDMVEAEVSLRATDFFSNGVAETCVGLSIVILAHTLLGWGMLPGNFQKLEDKPASNHLKHFPRFEAEYFQKNLQTCRGVEEPRSKERLQSNPAGAFLYQISQWQAQYATHSPHHQCKIRGEGSWELRGGGASAGELREIKSILDSFPVVGAGYPERTSKLAEY
jgi:pyridoxine 4-dehydrogenase